MLMISSVMSLFLIIPDLYVAFFFLYIKNRIKAEDERND